MSTIALQVWQTKILHSIKASVLVLRSEVTTECKSCFSESWSLIIIVTDPGVKANISISFLADELEQPASLDFPELTTKLKAVCHLERYLMYYLSDITDQW